MDEIRFVAGPIVGRYLDKVEEERQAVLKVEEEKAAKKRAEAEAKKKSEDESKKAADSKSSKNPTTTESLGPASEDADMKDTDAEGAKPDSVEDAGDDAGKK
jgi:heat shock 70kDa protein 4